MEQKILLTAPCLFGLESVLSFEIKQIGGQNIETTDGRVSFEGDEHVLARANLCLRTAERVCVVLGTFEANTFTELFDAVEQLPFEKYIDEYGVFPVTGWSLKSTLHSIPSCQSIIKKAVVRRMEQVYHREIFAETGALYQIRFAIHKNQVTIMLDASGETLHKRGYRQVANLAPIRETLAAGIADFARLREDSVVYDPMCGSGTLLIEAATRALNIAPGLQRSFLAEQWKSSNPEVWRKERQAAVDSIHRDCSFRAFGFDLDADALKQAKENAKKAGVGDRITFLQQDVARFTPTIIPCAVLCNPPYGERLLEEEEAQRLYNVMGERMPQKKDISYYIIAPEEFEKSFGRRANRRRKLYNGMIPCQLYMYFR